MDTSASLFLTNVRWKIFLLREQFCNKYALIHWMVVTHDKSYNSKHIKLVWVRTARTNYFMAQDIFFEHRLMAGLGGICPPRYAARIWRSMFSDGF